MAEEAVTIRRALAQARPDAFLPDLATSLNNQSSRLSNLGRREEALPAAEEAVTIRRALAQARPDAFLPDLAASLNNLADCLSALARNVTSWRARGFSPVTIGNDEGLLERALKALGRPAWEVTADDIDRLVGDLAVAGRRRRPAGSTCRSSRGSTGSCRRGRPPRSRQRSA